MSYILDALKKAERERGIQQIPTLMTDHAPRGANRTNIWIALFILVLCVSAVAWYFVHSQQTKPSLAIRAVHPVKSAPDADRTRLHGAAPNEGRPTKVPAAVVPGDAIRKQPIQSIIRLPIPADATIPDDEDYDDLPPREIISSIPRAQGKPAPSEMAKPQPASLQKAVSQMTLSLLMYSDVKEERMVYINGSRYKEGDYVEEIYLLESITDEGAILSYEGNRSLLQPKSK